MFVLHLFCAALSLKQDVNRASSGKIDGETLDTPVYSWKEQTSHSLRQIMYVVEQMRKNELLAKQEFVMDGLGTVKTKTMHLNL